MMQCLYLLVRIVYILQFNQFLAVKHTPVNMRIWQMLFSMHVKMLQKKMNLLKMCGPQNRFSLFMFRPITLKQLNSLTINNRYFQMRR